MTARAVVNSWVRVAARLLPTVAAVLLALPVGRAGDNTAGDIPVVGRPTDLPFSEASGSFRVSARAEPTTVEAEQPITLTLVVEADGPVHHPPRRVDLSQIVDFDERFYLGKPDAEDIFRPDARRWEFVYRLKPRRADVTEIPGIPFVFYNPAIRQANKAFQVKYTDPIPLQVSAASVVEPPPRPVADVFLRSQGGPSLLARQTPWSPPGLVFIALVLLAPPLVCAAWYVVWRRRHPDANVQKERRRSRAARQALAQLQKAERAAVETCALLTATAVADYLRGRVDLTIAEPTPVEAGACLRRAGCTPAIVEQAVTFLQTCDAARFWPPSVADGAKLPALARDVILALDADTEPRKGPEIEAPEAEALP